MATESKEICPVCGCSITGEPYETEGVMYCCEPCATGGACECECCRVIEEDADQTQQPSAH